MSNLSDFISRGGGKLRYQEFTSSGTFTPSAALLANGGQCYYELIGGGSAGQSLTAHSMRRVGMLANTKPASSQ